VTFDIFFALGQNEVDGQKPTERQVFENFFDQVRLADELGFGTAWVAETHLSSEVQKQNPGAVIPEYKGELGLNTDILQLAHKIFAQTKSIHVGSAIRNILCNGGPMAHAEAIRMFLSLHGLNSAERRQLNIGFASGRFPYSNAPYGIRPRNELEKAAWPVLRGLIFTEATEIFLRFLRGDVFASKDVTPKVLRRELFKTDQDWAAVTNARLRQTGGSATPESIEVEPFWVFEKSGVIPFEAPLENLRLTIGSHEPGVQVFANQFLPVGVFNLSITPGSVIEETHQRMSTAYHPDGGAWNRSLMPRTALVFIDEKRERALARAEKALKAYWQAMEGTVSQDKIDQAVSNALVGTRDEVREQVQSRFHPDDRIMFWFDFNNHDNENVKNSMRLLMGALR
jgi:alkanesulfonate monooxygenase SsuD/methylene tetrahydromethanopterin reductase-like flavin-dependent oxidoreductase (luciferase family)